MSSFGFRMAGHEPKRRSLWHFALAFVVIVGFAAFSLTRLLGGPADFEPGTKGAVVTVNIETGASLRMIGQTLEAAGVVASTEAFVQASNANPQARYITPGDYKLPSHVPAASAISLLLNPATRDEIRLVVPEGLRASDVEQLVAAKLSMDSSAVHSAFSTATLPASAKGAVEGYLFPATYGVKRSATPNDIATMMLARFRQAAADLELERRARAEQLSVHDVMVIASLVQMEAMPKDFSKVARVIMNRMAKGMRLQLDSSVNYGLGLSKVRLSQAQLAKDTPYNLYLNDGLPPTPICNPGAAAIEAALSPARGDWLYFVTTDTTNGVTEFATTYDDFLVLKAKFKRNN